MGRVARQHKLSKKGLFLVTFISILFVLFPAISGAVSYFSDDMEGAAKWTADDPWNTTTTTYHSPTTTWTDSPAGYYANNADVSLTLVSAVNLSSATNPQLVFWHKYQIESSFDFGYLEISTDGGTTWSSTKLATFTGISDWRREQIDLSSFAGETNVKIRFRLTTDKTIVWDGWTIDDVNIAEPPNAVATLTAGNPTATSLDISWNKSLDPVSEFASYKVYRSATAGVSTNSTLVATITDQNITTLTDIKLNPQTTYYYKVFVFSTNDLAAGSKEESGTTSIAEFSYPFFDDMEGGVGGWKVSSSWGLTTVDKHSGSYAWTDSPGGAYAAGVDASLQITVDLGKANMPVLSFWHRYTFDTNSDYGYVEVREDGSTTWNRLYFATGTLASWSLERVDLSGFAGKKVDIRFRLIADTNGIQSYGWYLDDIKIDETEKAVLPYPFLDNMDGPNSAANWHSSSWDLVADAHSGNYAFTDSLAGPYGSLTNSELIMANAIDLTNAVHPQLSFWHKYETGDNGGFYCPNWTSEYDYALLYLSTYNGQAGTWRELARFKGNQATWTRRQIDLSTWAGLPNVRIKFVMNDNKSGSTGNCYRLTGWTIDDIAIEEVPVDVTLAVDSSSMFSISLSWTQNQDQDFDHYEIYRSSSPGVSRSSTLIATISTQTAITYTDPIAIIQPGTYYYRMWVLDSDGNTSLGSNEVQASYAVPSNGFPFSEDGESGTAKWSWGTPWGLSDITKYEGTYSWTDSPGANYAANANTSLTTFLDLSGTTTPVLTFWHRYFLEEGKDFVRLEISTNSGQTWVELRSFTGTEILWNQERVNLTPFAGNSNLGFRFRLTSDGANQRDGWYMDNLVIAEEAVQAPYPFSDDMESGIVPWFYTSPWGLKTLTEAESRSGVASTAWTDSPEGSYASGADTSLQLSIDLGAANMPVLTFWQKYALDTNSDYGYIEVREGGTSTWKRLYFMTGSSASWVEERVDLSGYAGKQIDLRFRLVADTNGVQSDGWHIDDITIDETNKPPIPYPFKDNMENAATVNNWHSSSWALVADAYSGNYAFTDSPAGPYGDLVNSELIMSNIIDLSAAIHPQLSFWHKYETGDNGGFYCPNWTSEYDYVLVYLSTYNGQSGTWQQLAAFKGSQSAWARRQIDLSSWAGLPNVRIKFVMNDNKSGSTGNCYRLAGWTIDEIAVEEAPVDVILAIDSSSMNTVALSWIQNTDEDFKRYELYRSSTPGVTRSNTLITGISEKASLTYIDAVAMIQPGTYYYRMWVIDIDGNVSMGSNEVQASYTVPGNGFPFSDAGESGTGKWSFGSPWGLTDKVACEGNYAWTDSPGANYAANANTSLTTFIDLSGTATPVLRFWHRYSLEDGKDFLRMEVSTDNGQSWITLRSITGTETFCNEERINLTPYAGQANLGVRFRLTSDGTNQQDGWYMDALKIEEEVIQASYPFSDNMENGIIPWFYDSPWGLMTLTADQSRTGEATTVWTDSPGGSYNAGADSSLYLKIDLGSANMPVLSFWHRYTFDTNSDFAYIEVREGGTTNWKRLYFTTGSSASWVQERMDLSDYAGRQIDLRFRVVADSNGIQSDGWYIDDITISETESQPSPYPFVDGMEGAGSLTNWHNSSWDLVADAHGGSLAFTDSPVGSYGDLVNSELIMANTIDLRGAVHPQLSFWHKYETGNNGGFYCPNWTSEYDYARVYLSPYNGQAGTWTQLAAFKGSQSTWKQEKISLSTWAGLPNIRIKFVMNDNKSGSTGNCYRLAGWTLDDVRIGEDEAIPSYIQKVSGDGQVAQTGTALSNAFKARVYDSNSKPRSGILVNFTIIAGDGSLSTGTATSDTQGFVSTELTLGTTAGINSVSATIDGSTEAVVFSATGYTVGQAMTLTKVSGDYQVSAVNQALPNPLIVKVTDILGSPVEGVGINFGILSGGGTLSITTLVVTNNEGFASNTLTLGANTGATTVSVTSAGLIGSPATFTAYAVLEGGYFGDTDGDGIPDEWELAKGLNPNNAADALLDPDNDGLINKEEYMRGSNPNSADSDSDGMPDGWEVKYGLNPLDPKDASKDYNNNGITNLQEYLNETSPVFEKHFKIAGVTSESTDFFGSVTINGMPAEPGDEVAVICPGTPDNPDNVICGQFTVTTAGQYGFMHVYKDDPNTPEDEGADVGDDLIFRVWDASAGMELDATVTVITGTNPPAWTADGAIAQVNINGAGKQIIPLHAGWNLISFSVKNAYYMGQIPQEPMLPGVQYLQVNSIAEVLASLDGLYEVVRSFDSIGAHTFDPALPEFSDLKYMAAGYGYWIKMKEAASLELVGVRAAPSDNLELRSGWNLSGYWGNDIRYVGGLPAVDFPPDATVYTYVNSMGNCFNPIAGQYAVIRSFDSAGSHTYDPLLPGNFNNLKYMGPGYGMWIKMKTVGTLSYE